MSNILIVDDHSIVREGFRLIFKTMPEISEIGEASTGREALQMLESENWSVVILDISLPDTSGIEVLKQIKANYPKLPVLVLTMHAEEQYAIRVLRSGASGFLNKGCESEQLIEAVQKLLKGSKYISPTLAEKLAFSFGNETSADPHESLSDREFEVLRFIAAGKKNKEIAEELCLSQKTVSTYHSRILQKMNLQSRAELIHYAIEKKLI